MSRRYPCTGIRRYIMVYNYILYIYIYIHIYIVCLCFLFMYIWLYMYVLYSFTVESDYMSNTACCSSMKIDLAIFHHAPSKSFWLSCILLYHTVSILIVHQQLLNLEEFPDQWTFGGTSLRFLLEGDRRRWFWKGQLLFWPNVALKCTR